MEDENIEPYITFDNGSQPALNDINVNNMQKLIKQDIITKFNDLKQTISETVLYENATGVSGDGSITLSESISNFDKIKIVYDLSNNSNINNRYVYSGIREFDTSNTSSLLLSELLDKGYYATISISQNILSITRNRTTNAAGVVSEGNYFIITKVIGVKENGNNEEA